MRVAVWIMTGFGVLALALATVGIYGVFWSFVGERTQEIAVRLTLRATPAAVRGLVVGRALALTGAALAIGLSTAIALSVAAGGLLYEVEALDVTSYGAAALCVAGVAVASCWLPARRASRVDPQVRLARRRAARAGRAAELPRPADARGDEVFRDGATSPTSRTRRTGA